MAWHEPCSVDRMSPARIRLAHLFVLFAVAGCSASHGLGPDAGVAADGGLWLADGWVAADAWLVGDAGPAGSCAAQDARAQVCPAALCDGPPQFFWSGDRCFMIDCGACVGSACGAGYPSPEACVAAHASCEPSMCRATGGTWQWWAAECGHFVCGQPPPQLCLVGQPACDCGIQRSFDPARGCFDDPSCGVLDPLPADVLCTSTGGTWSPICCDTVCGQPCPLACASPACDCGPMRIFDPVRGCMLGARCYERLANETCAGGARCADGTICCEHCGGAGCHGDPTCQAPLCGAGPELDVCGNCVTCP